MTTLLHYADLLLDFFVNDLVPFLTVPPEHLNVFILWWGRFEVAGISTNGWHLKPLELPWLFGDISIGQLVLTVLIPVLIGIRLFKALWDALPFV